MDDAPMDAEYQQEAAPAQEQEPAVDAAMEPEPAAEHEHSPEPDVDVAAAEPEMDYAAEPAADPEPEQQPDPVPVAVPEEKEEPVQVAEYGGDVPATVGVACDTLYSDQPSFDWFCVKLKDPKKGTSDLVVDAVGTGGLNELVQKMKGMEKDIAFFMLRCNTFDNEGSERAKFIYGRFVGTKVPFMTKAKMTPNLGAIADQFQVKHLSKDADESMKDWTPEHLAKEFLRIGGAHKPSKYDFGANAVYQV